MSTIQNTDEISVLRNGTHYRAPVTRLENLGPGDSVGVSRGGTDYCVPGDQLEARIQGTDFLAVGRGNVDYKAVWSDFAAFFIPRINVKSITMKDITDGDRSQVEFTVLYGSTGPHPPKPWNNYLTMMQRQFYYELKTPSGTTYYAHGFPEGRDGGIWSWFWGLSTSLLEGNQGQGSQVHFDNFLTWQQAYNAWIFGLRGEEKYWVDVPIKFSLSIPYRWNYYNTASSTDENLTYRAKALPPGTQIRFSILTENWTTNNKTPLVQSAWFPLPQP